MRTESESLSAAPNWDPRKRPSIRNTDDLWCWMNTWGDLDQHEYTGYERRAYEQAMSDLLERMKEAGITFDSVPTETWMRWSKG